MRKNWTVAWLFFEFLFFCGLFTLSEKLAYAGEVLPAVRVLTDKATGTDVFNKADMNDAVQRFDSGLEGTAHSKVVSGVPGGPTTGGPASIEFAIAPIGNGGPSYKKALFVKSDKAGKYKISVPPGKYWIGPKAKALDPINYVAGEFSFSEKIVVVEQGTFTQVDLFEVGYAP